MGIINYINQKVFNRPVEDPYQAVAEEFTAEVNQELLAQLKQKEKEVKQLKEIIGVFAGGVYLSVVNALSDVHALSPSDEEDKEDVPDDENYDDNNYS